MTQVSVEGGTPLRSNESEGGIVSAEDGVGHDETCPTMTQVSVEQAESPRTAMQNHWEPPQIKNPPPDMP